MGYYNASNKLITGYREAQSEQQKLRFPVDTAKAARGRQDNVVAKVAAEHYKAELVYQRKRSKHIMAKKERAAINKSVKYAETAYKASSKMVKHFQGLTWCGEQAAKHATEIFRLQGVVRSSFSCFGSEELRMLRDCGDTYVHTDLDEQLIQ